AILNELSDKSRANLPKTIKIATPWYKPDRNTTDIVPDFFVHETDQWLVFPHELSGLSDEEIAADKPEIWKTISAMNAKTADR
ncbi:MAG: hypoxanthine phosphoribosyltransferase, partial [Gammaproteobacteria bacterium]|nr:hypoxanthine phosphoribosyltransferase [Gammaproteobacteria bacterium]